MMLLCTLEKKGIGRHCSVTTTCGPFSHNFFFAFISFQHVIHVVAPSESLEPSSMPSRIPSGTPSSEPSGTPSSEPSGEPSSAPSMAPSESCTITVVDDGDDGAGNFSDVGLYSSLQINDSNNPVISYYDTTDDVLKLVLCQNGDCSSIVGTTPVVVDSVGGAMLESILHSNWMVTKIPSFHTGILPMANLKLAVCTKNDCSGASAKPLASTTQGRCWTVYFTPTVVTANPSFHTMMSAMVP